MADDGDGSGDPDMTVLQLRHMLGASEFKNAIHGIRSPATILQDMAAYAPQGPYISTSAFETAVPCLIEKR